LSQKQAAELLGVGLRTLARWENGDAEPVGRLAEAAIEKFLRGE
jgi:DNA-binding transcriptional regulator YiaG